jgi:hypothetical protein
MSLSLCDREEAAILQTKNKENENFIITQLTCTNGILQAYIQVLAKINKVTNF